MIQYNIHALFLSEYSAHHKLLFGLTRVLYFYHFFCHLSWKKPGISFDLQKYSKKWPHLFQIVLKQSECTTLGEKWLLVLDILFILLEDSDSSCSLQMDVCVLFHLCSIKYHFNMMENFILWEKKALRKKLCLFSNATWVKDLGCDWYYNMLFKVVWDNCSLFWETSIGESFHVAISMI